MDVNISVQLTNSPQLHLWMSNLKFNLLRYESTLPNIDWNHSKNFNIDDRWEND